MCLIHALILLFLWIITSYLAIKNIEEYYQMKKPVKKQNERLGVIFIVLCCLVFRSVISTYIVYVLMFNALYYIIYKIFKNKYLDKSFYLTFIIPIVIVIIGNINVNNIVITKYNLSNKDISKDIRVAYVSDVHLSTLDKKKLDNLVKIVNDNNYDIFVIDGDLVDEFSTDRKIKDVIEELGSIKTKYGNYYVEGNHDLLTNKLNVLVDNKINPPYWGIITDNYSDMALIKKSQHVFLIQYSNKKNYWKHLSDKLNIETKLITIYE